MKSADSTARNILADLEARLDGDHISEVSQRHRAIQNFETVDRLPLSVYIPYEGTHFHPYPIPETMTSPAKMLVNELLLGFSSIYHLVGMHTDTPLCIRPNLGVTIIASLFGASIELRGDQPPWVRSLDGLDKIQAAVESPPGIAGGLLDTALEMYAYFRQVLADFPKCRQAIQITLPDLQGSFDIAELLWGSDIFPAFYTHPELLSSFLAVITQTILDAYQVLIPNVCEDIRPEHQYQHATSVAGKLLVRADTAIMVSPKMYRKFIQPHDARLAEELQGIGIHFCGNGQHQIAPMLEIDQLKSFDFGQSDMMDVQTIYAQAQKDGVTLNRVQLPDAHRAAAKAQDLYPTGVTLLYKAESVSEAADAWEHYISGD